MPSYLSGSTKPHDIKNPTYFYMYLSLIWFIISHKFNLTVFLCFNIYKTTQPSEVAYTSIWSRRPRIYRILPKVLFKMMLELRHIYIYTCLQFDLSLLHEFNLTELMCFIKPFNRQSDLKYHLYQKAEKP